MSEKMPERVDGQVESKEAVSTADTYEAITAAAEGKKVVFTYSEHYNSLVTFEPNGKVIVQDQEVPEYEHKMGSEDSSMDAYITDMRKAIETVKKATVSVPVGNVERFGGMNKIAQDIMDASQIEAYIKAYEKMTPEQQENFRNTMSDRRKK